MITSTSNRRRLPLILAVGGLALALAALACGPTLTGGAATSAPVSTKEAATEEGGTEDGGTTDATDEPTKESGGGEITAENIGDLTDIRSMTVSTQALLAVAVSGSGHEVATAGADSIMRLWDADTGKKLKEFPRLADYGFGLAYSRDGKVLASGAGYDVGIWDPDTGKRTKSVTPNAGVYRMAISPDGETLAVAGYRRSKLDLIDIGGGQITTLSSSFGYELWSASFSLDGEYLAAADNQGNVTLFDANGNSQIATATAKGAAWDLEFSPDGKYVTTCNATSNIGGINTWETPDLLIYDNLTLPEIHKGGCLDGVYSKNGDVFFSVGADGVLNAWETSSGKLLFTKNFGSPTWAVSVAGDGTFAAVALDDGTLHIMGFK